MLLVEVGLKGKGHGQSTEKVRTGALMCRSSAEAGREVVRARPDTVCPGLQTPLCPLRVCCGTVLRHSAICWQVPMSCQFPDPCGREPGKPCPQLNFYSKKFKAVSRGDPEASRSVLAALSGMKKDQGVCRWS